MGTTRLGVGRLKSMTAGKLLGRSSAGSGSPQEITVGSGLSLSGTTLSATGGGGGGGVDWYGPIELEVNGEYTISEVGTGDGRTALIANQKKSPVVVQVDGQTAGAQANGYVYDGSYRHAITAVGGAARNASGWIDFDGTDDAIITNLGGVLGESGWSSGPWVAEAYLYPTATPSGAGMMSSNTSAMTAGSSSWLLWQYGTHAYLHVSSTGGSWNIVNAYDLGEMTINGWTHWAVVYNPDAYPDGNDFTVYKDGVVAYEGMHGPTSLLSGYSHAYFSVGKFAGACMTGRATDIRVTHYNGRPGLRYTGEFTPAAVNGGNFVDDSYYWVPVQTMPVWNSSDYASGGLYLQQVGLDVKLMNRLPHFGTFSIGVMT